MYSEIKENLLTLPLKIKDKESELYAVRNTIDEKDLQKKLIEDSVYMDVYNAVKKEGGREFTNDIQRKAETKKRLSNGEDYKNLKEEIIELKEKLSKGLIELDFLKRKFRAFESLTRM